MQRSGMLLLLCTGSLPSLHRFSTTATHTAVTKCVAVQWVLFGEAIGGRSFSVPFTRLGEVDILVGHERVRVAKLQELVVMRSLCLLGIATCRIFVVATLDL